MPHILRHNNRVTIFDLNDLQTARILDACTIPETQDQPAQPMVQVGPGPTIFGPPGLFQRIKDLLQETSALGTVVDKRARTHGDSERPDWQILYPLVAQELKRALELAENGTIIAPCGSGKTRIVATILDFLGPKSQGLVIGGSTTETEQLYRELKAMLPWHKFGIRTGQTKTPPTKVMVTTVESAAKAMEPAACEFIITDEAHKSGKPTGLNLLEQLTERCAHRYGLTAEIRRYDRHELWLEAHIGPQLLNIPYLEAQENRMVAPMEVWAFPTPDARQALAAGWPLTVIDRDFRLLEQTGIYNQPFLHKYIAHTIIQNIPEEAPALICVEKITQGQAIQNELAALGRQVPILHSRLPGGKVRSLKEDFKAGKFQQLIATKILNTGFNRPDIVFVVNAIGMYRLSDTVQRSGRATRPQKQPEHQNGVVIEFIHRYHPTLHNLWEKRAGVYQELGWTIIQKPMTHGWEKRAFTDKPNPGVYFDPAQGIVQCQQ